LYAERAGDKEHGIAEVVDQWRVERGRRYTAFVFGSGWEEEVGNEEVWAKGAVGVDEGLVGCSGEGGGEGVVGGEDGGGGGV